MSKHIDDYINKCSKCGYWTYFTMTPSDAEFIEHKCTACGESSIAIWDSKAQKEWEKTKKDIDRFCGLIPKLQQIEKHGDKVKIEPDDIFPFDVQKQI